MKMNVLHERLQSIILKLPFAQSKFFRHVFVLSSASVMAQLVNIASMPVLSRLYSPSDFGVLSLFTSVVNLLATVSGFRYYLVLPLTRRKRYVHAIVWLSVLLQIAFVAALALIAVLFGNYLGDTPYAALMPYRFLIPVGVLCIGMYTLAVQWCIREKNFSLIAKTKLTQVFAACAVNVTGAVVGLRPLGLLLGNIAGQSCGLSVLMRTQIKSSGRVKYDFTRIRRAAIYYRDMCFLSTPAALLNMAGAYLLPLLFAFYFSPSVVGAFAMAQHALVLPSAIIGSAIGQVFTQRAGEAKYNGTLPNLTARAFELLARLGLFPILLCSVLAPELFTIILGAKWVEAGRFAAWLGPWIALNFIYSPLSTLYTTLMMQRMGMIFVSVYTTLRLGSVAFGGDDPIIAVSLLSLSGACAMIVGLSLLLYRAGVDKVCRRFAILTAETLIEMTPIIFIRLASIDSLLHLCAAAAASAAIYLVFLFTSYKRGKI